MSRFFQDVELLIASDSFDFNNATKEEAIIRCSTTPFKGPSIYFNHYFRTGGTVEHPRFGNLLDFASKVEERWKGDGCNLVTGLIQARVSEQESRFRADNSFNNPQNF
jgi:hypothetical protein